MKEYVMSLVLEPRYYVFHIAIFFIALSLIATIIYEMRKPKQDPNDDPETKRINDMLKD
jgi:hypothetical protein